MRKTILRIALLIFLLLVGAAAIIVQNGLVRRNRLETVTRDNSAFAIDLYQQLRPTDGNLFFSPYSISTSFAMVYAGASGNTKAQMASVLHFSLGQRSLHQAFAASRRYLQRYTVCQLDLGNALWSASNSDSTSRRNSASLRHASSRYDDRSAPVVRSRAARKIALTSRAWFSACEFMVATPVHSPMRNPPGKLTEKMESLEKISPGDWARPADPTYLSGPASSTTALYKRARANAQCLYALREEMPSISAACPTLRPPK